MQDLTRRRLTSMFAAASVSFFGAVSAALVYQKYRDVFDEELQLPSIPDAPVENPVSLFPDISPPLDLTPKPASPPIDEQSLRQQQAGRAKKCFDRAVQQDLLPIMDKVCQLTGMTMPELMALAAFESDMGKHLAVDSISDKKAGTHTQTAAGIVQIINGTFYDYAKRYAVGFEAAILAYGGTGGKAMMAALPYLQQANPCRIDHTRDAALIERLITKRQKQLAVKIHDPKRARAEAERTVTQAYDDNIKSRVLAGRQSSFTSMLLAATHASRLSRNLDPALRAKLKGAEVRLFHMFGEGGAPKMLDALQRDPTMTMDVVLGVAGVQQTDDRWKKLRDNHIDPKTTIRDFIQQMVVAWTGSTDQFAASYADYLREHKLDSIEVALAKKPQSAVATATSTQVKQPARPADSGATRRGLFTGAAPKRA